MWEWDHKEVCVSHSVVSDSAAPWIVAHRAPLSLGLSRQQYWKWVAIPISRRPSQLRDWTQVSCIAGKFFFFFFAGKFLISWAIAANLKKAECWRIDAFELVLEKTLESHLDCTEIKPVNLKESALNIHWKDWCWTWSSNTLATWCKEPTHWKRPWCWKSLKEKRVVEDEMVR